MDLIIWTGEWSKNWLSFTVTESSKARYRERKEKKKISEIFMCFNLELGSFWEPIYLFIYLFIIIIFLIFFFSFLFIKF